MSDRTRYYLSYAVSQACRNVTEQTSQKCKMQITFSPFCYFLCPLKQLHTYCVQNVKYRSSAFASEPTVMKPVGYPILADTCSHLCLSEIRLTVLWKLRSYLVSRIMQSEAMPGGAESIQCITSWWPRWRHPPCPTLWLPLKLEDRQSLEGRGYGDLTCPILPALS